MFNKSIKTHNLNGKERGGVAPLIKSETGVTLTQSVTQRTNNYDEVLKIFEENEELPPQRRVSTRRSRGSRSKGSSSIVGRIGRTWIATSFAIIKAMTNTNSTISFASRSIKVTIILIWLSITALLFKLLATRSSAPAIILRERVRRGGRVSSWVNSARLWYWNPLYKMINHY